MSLITFLCLLMGLAGPAMAASAPASQILAPFYTGAAYDPPPVGSYQLPSLGLAADGVVLDTDGNPAQLYDIMDDKIVLLSFVYSSCSDVNGCPLATAVMYSIQQKVVDVPAVRDRFRMISLSFDPEHDTPEIMHLYGEALSDADWRFLTTESQDALTPILDAYGQTVIRDNDADGTPLPSYSHILRVFLIDAQRRIRNIYSVSFLYPDLIVNDIKTLLALMAEPTAAEPLVLAEAQQLSRPGDFRDGYETTEYRTRSDAVELRSGEPADLIGFAENPPLGLPPLVLPADNPMTRDKVQLGRKLFFDRRLSLNDTFSCAMCHVAEQGFGSNELAMAVGVEGRTVRRNTPTLYNVAYAQRLFHDGREETLEQQAWGPLLARNEMANPSIGYVLAKIRRMPDYKGLFEASFGRGPTMETVGQALAAYQRTLNSGNSPFDRWRFGGDGSALSPSAQRGFELFIGKAGCVACHEVGQASALLTDNRMHNTGIGYRESMGIRPATQRVTLAPGIVVDVDMDLIDSVGEAPPSDLGLYEVTQDPDDRWKYKTPTLRNVALTAPYMHNGSIGTLAEVIRFYNQGGIDNELKDPLIRPLGLSDAEMVDLVGFLESLTGDNVDTLVSDAFAAPIGDITSTAALRAR